jgi:hypothetical protein
MKDHFYLITDSVEDDVQGSKENTIRGARKTKSAMEHSLTPSGCHASDDGPMPDVHIYRIERIA